MTSASEAGGIVGKLLAVITLILFAGFVLGVCVASDSTKDCGGYQDGTCPAPHTTVSQDPVTRGLEGSTQQPGTAPYRRRANPSAE